MTFTTLIEENAAVSTALFKLLWDMSNRNKDNFYFLLCYFGSGFGVVCPPKKAMLLLDQGGGGKSVACA